MDVSTHRCSFLSLLLVLSIMLSSSSMVNGKPVFEEDQVDPMLDYATVEEICQGDSLTARLLCRLILGQTMQNTQEVQQTQRISKRNAIDAFVNLLQTWGVRVEDARAKYQQLLNEGLIDSNGRPVGPSTALRELMLSRNRPRIS